jgi:serine/threonine protein kinase
MAISADARVGPYQILSMIGTGGMGEVYQARDVRLDRLVAIKVLNADGAERADRRARFETEARVVSTLSHPHICTLFDVGDHDGHAYLVMEYLEGETLDDRLTRGPLPAADVLRYGAEIADALDHAHRKQIIHRDVKPSNVMLTTAGAKLLDFGLAKRPLPVAATSISTASLDQRKLTAEGTLIGTFQYMAPEQLEGKSVDGRTDIFALGSVLYEMAAGRKAFEGDSQASLIASILTAQPPAISSVRAATDANSSLAALEHVVERCLAKNPDERWQTARDVKLELEWIDHGKSFRRVFIPTGWKPHWREAVAWSLALIAGVVAAIALMTPSENARTESTQFTVSPAPGTTIPVAQSRTRIAASPDGRRLAMVTFSQGRNQIWIRSLDSVAAEPLSGTEGGISPFWSPDSRFVGFFSPGDGTLKKVALAGGPARTICAAQVDSVPTWGRDGTILFTKFLDGIFRVSADGGVPSRVTQVDKGRRELNHYWPEFLPDGQHFLYMATALEESGLRATPSVYIASLDSPEVTLLTREHSRMTYVEPGYLLFVDNGALLAQRFDASKRQQVGEPIQIADGVAYVRTVGNGSFTASTNGVLAYQSAGSESQVVWADRRGNITETGWPRQDYGSVRFSPDGERVAVDVVDPRTGAADVWLFDTARGAPVRFTADPSDESGPVWSPDGSRILLRMDRGGPASLKIGSAAPNLYAKVIGTGAEELIAADRGPLGGEDWSRDGRWVAYSRTSQQTGLDLWLMRLTDGAKPQPFSTERFDEGDATFSPDSRWLAFVSTEAGLPEVYVAPLERPGERTRVSDGGGTTPRWHRDGTELFYASPDGRAIVRVGIQLGPTLKAGVPARLFTIPASSAARAARRSIIYDVTPDGQRFLINLPLEEPSSSRITVVLNWMAALNK